MPERVLFIALKSTPLIVFDEQDQYSGSPILKSNAIQTSQPTSLTISVSFNQRQDVHQRLYNSKIRNRHRLAINNHFLAIAEIVMRRRIRFLAAHPR